MPVTRESEPTGRRPSRLGAAMQNALSAAHTFIFRSTKGAIGGRVVNSPVLLLTMKGRKTGKQRTVPLLYLADGDNFVIVASNGGAVKHPTWWLNLQASPEAEIEIKGGKRRVRARAAAPEEKQRLWPALTSMYSGYERYQEITNRDIPVVILHPVE